MFINKELDNYSNDLSIGFWDATWEIERDFFMPRPNEWTFQAAVDIIKMYCGM